MSYYASYYKCALQVNPYSYSRYRGEEIQNEEEYNNEILAKCEEHNISIVGLADHGCVDSSESLRKKLSENGIVVFPGFEIMSAEKVHMVCLFSENKCIADLYKCLGACGLEVSSEGNETSSKTCLEIANVVEKANGFWYAAHITSDNGVLKLGKMQNIWKSEALIAAQIPDSKINIDPKYKNIINNVDPNYQRTKAPAYINACDIDKPIDLDKETATTLVKMSKPTFENFVMAFKDPESRIRLNSELEKGYQSSLKTLRVFGGYLDGLQIDFSNNLVTIIGGRGTGKSTIINLIRYALDLVPEGKEHAKEFDDMIVHNLGSNSRVELDVISNEKFGKQFKIIRRYKMSPTIQDDLGNVSNFTCRDILPSIEIYGQNEIVDAIKDPAVITSIVKRLFDDDAQLSEMLDSAYHELNLNSQLLRKLEQESERDEEKIADLPALQEQLKYYNKAGIPSKLSLLTKLIAQETEFEQLLQILDTATHKFPLIEFNTQDKDLANLNLMVDKFNEQVSKLNKEYEATLHTLQEQYQKAYEKWHEKQIGYDEEIKASLKEIEGIQDKSSADIVSEYTDLVKKIKSAEPIESQANDRTIKIEKIKNSRKNLIETCRKLEDSRKNFLNQQLKKINKKKLNGIVELSIEFNQQKELLLQRLMHISGIGPIALLGIEKYPDFEIFTFVEDIRNGADSLKKKYSLTKGTAEKITNALNEIALRDIESMRLPDIYTIKLNVNGTFKSMKNLSKGQQCTAILNILLLDNKDPLIIDQPEDNLDNAFVAEDLIKTIRDNKIRRQYIFATHNANIPVFGDAELIIAMEEVDGHGHISDEGIGSIDSEKVKAHVVQILEGGKTAFKMRESKYGL